MFGEGDWAPLSEADSTEDVSAIARPSITSATSSLQSADLLPYQNGSGGSGGGYLSGETFYEIREVYAWNFFEEFAQMLTVAKEHSYAAISVKCYGNFICEDKNEDEWESYEILQMNVNRTSISQLGLTFFDFWGNVASTWQFNFSHGGKDSASLPGGSGGVTIAALQEGISPNVFSEALVTSGLICSDKITWLCFDGAYDLAHFMRLIVNLPLPQHERNFLETLYAKAPRLYDAKYLLKSCKMFDPASGMHQVARELKLQRVAGKGGAAMDSITAGRIFFKLKSRYYENDIDEAKYLCRVKGLKSKFALANAIRCLNMKC